MTSLRLILFFLSFWVFGCALQDIRKQLVKISEDQKNDSKIITYRLEPSAVIKIRQLNDKISKEQFLEKTEAQKSYFRRMFKINIEPYFGKPDKDIDCVKKIDLVPILTETPVVSFMKFELGATENYVYGTCDKKLEVYQSEFLLVYCKQQKIFYEIKSFSPDKLGLSQKIDFSGLCQTSELQ